MKLRIKAALLVLLGVTAGYSAEAAYRSLQPIGEQLPPAEIFAPRGDSEAAEYYLKTCDGLIAVYAGAGARRPERVTAIETAGLRHMDRALLARGIPVADREALLALLEDLGS